MTLNTQVADQMIGGASQIPGVVLGLVVRDPQSATLTTTIEGGWIRQRLSTGAIQLSRIADTSKAFTASKDTYVYVNSSGALAYYENTLDATKPSQATLETTGGVGSQFIAKVVTDGSRVVSGGCTDLRQMSGADLREHNTVLSFNATEVGAYYWTPNVRTRVWAVKCCVIDTLANTDVGTVTAALGANDVYTDMTNGAVSHALSSATGTRNAAFPSASFIVAAGQTVRLTSAKATAGGTTAVQVVHSPF